MKYIDVLYKIARNFLNEFSLILNSVQRFSIFFQFQITYKFKQQMGGICSSQKQSKFEKQTETLSHNCSATQSPQKLQEEKPIVLPSHLTKAHSEWLIVYNREMLSLTRTLCQLVELLGSLGELSNQTRSSLNSIIIIRSNLAIYVKFTIRKAFQNSGIQKKIQDEDEQVLYYDLKVRDTLTEQLSKVVGLVDRELRQNDEFEQMFPILSMAFFNLVDDIKRLSNPLFFLYLFSVDKPEMRNLTISLQNQKKTTSIITLPPITTI